MASKCGHRRPNLEFSNLVFSTFFAIDDACLKQCSPCCVSVGPNLVLKLSPKGPKLRHFECDLGFHVVHHIPSIWGPFGSLRAHLSWAHDSATWAKLGKVDPSGADVVAVRSKRRIRTILYRYTTCANYHSENILFGAGLILKMRTPLAEAVPTDRWFVSLAAKRRRILVDRFPVWYWLRSRARKTFLQRIFLDGAFSD